MNNRKRAIAAALVLVFMSGCSKEPTTTEAPVAPEAAAVSPPTAAMPTNPGGGELTAYALPQKLAATGHCSLDAINGEPTDQAKLTAGADVTFSGWMADAANQVPTDAFLVLKGEANTYAVPVTADVERPDVAATLASNALKSAGFNLATKLAGVVPGTYDSMLVFGPVGNQESCPLQAGLVIAK